MLACIPEPVLSRAILPAGPADEHDLLEALALLVRADQTLRVTTDSETRQPILSGMSEPHLDAAVAKLPSLTAARFALGNLIVAYRQTISQPVEIETRYIRQTGGRGKFALIRMLFEPLDAGQCAEWARRREAEGQPADPHNLYFLDRSDGALPRECIQYAEKGFCQAAVKGIQHGFPCADMQGVLLGGKYHEVGDYFSGFLPAGIECMHDAQVKAGITLLEPIMSVLVQAPETCLDTLASDVNNRRGEVLDFSAEGGCCSLHAAIPLACLLGYAAHLRNLGPHSTSVHMKFSHYARTKEDLAVLPRASGA
jgi:elongation factor G